MFLSVAPSLYCLFHGLSLGFFTFFCQSISLAPLFSRSFSVSVPLCLCYTPCISHTSPFLCILLSLHLHVLSLTPCLLTLYPFVFVSFSLHVSVSQSLPACLCVSVFTFPFNSLSVCLALCLRLSSCLSFCHCLCLSFSAFSSLPHSLGLTFSSLFLSFLVLQT